jgi:ATP synthase I chain
VNTPSAPSDVVDPFYNGAVRRIARATVIWAVMFIPIVAWRYGAPATIGFAAGAAISWLNFHFLARGVEKLAERIVKQDSPERGSVVIGRFLLRYLLVGVIAYAIFIGYSLGFRGFLFGLCVPVAAMLTEAVYEARAAFRDRE